MTQPIQIRTFRAKSLSEALARIRRELGPDAVILETKPAARSQSPPRPTHPLPIPKYLLNHPKGHSSPPPIHRRSRIHRGSRLAIILVA